MDDAAEREEGGDPVCWAFLVCPDCGAITSEGHRAGCQLAEQAAALPTPDEQPPAGQARDQQAPAPARDQQPPAGQAPDQRA